MEGLEVMETQETKIQGRENKMANSIYQAIANAMVDISPIAKEKKNAQQGFQYRGIDDVMNELSPILTKHRIFIYPEVIEKERSERQTKSGGALIYSILTIKYHFATDDGSEICTTVIGEGMDSGDKASNKAMAVAFKYACLQMFCIPTVDMPDPDSGTPPPLSPNNQHKTSENKQEPRAQVSEQTWGEKLASEDDDPELPTTQQKEIPEEAKELFLLLEDGKLGSFTKPAEKALKDGDLNTVRGILNLYKQGRIK